MKRRQRTAWSYAPLVFVPAAVVTYAPAEATVYMSIEQAQQAMFPGAALTAVPLKLSDQQKAAIERQSGVRLRSPEPRIWRAGDGGVFIVDEVLGKHDYITYALAIGATGAVQSIEILEYRETYGFEIRDPGWRAQFVGKTSASPLKLDNDIRNIGGATLSCRHVTDGVKKLLALHDIALR